jgi:type IV secretory pathway VirB2 component (pilin)
MRPETILSRIILSAAIAAFIAHPAFASSGGGLPWEGPLEQIQKSITGPVAGFIALAAVAVAGGMLIFGGELNDFARRLMYVVLVAGILLGATQIVALFGATGASIGLQDTAQPSAVAQIRETVHTAQFINERVGEGGHV